MPVGSKETYRESRTISVNVYDRSGGREAPTEEELRGMEQWNASQVEKPQMRNRVREIRENKLMTQAQLAKKAKVALRTIHSVEKGMNCRMDTKRKILLALGLRFEDKGKVFLD
jgi:DNA-binding XRE family transcriptional regulator